MSSESRFGDVGGGEGFAPAPALGSFGAGAAVASHETTASISEFSVSTRAPGSSEVLQGGRSRGEHEFYQRRPEQPSFKLGSDHVSYSDLSHAQRTENGHIQISPGKVVSSQDFLQMKKTFESIESSYNDSYSKWWDEGMARGYVAGSPHERI